jgi:chitinase
MSFTNRNGRKLSYPRLTVLILFVLAVGISAFFFVQQVQDRRQASSRSPWFAGYVDVTATPSYSFQQLGSTNHKDAVLSFIVSSPNEPCTPTWGASYTLDQANASLSLDTRIARLQQQGGSVAISFGGRDNDEMGNKCTDPKKLQAAYQAVIDRYKIDTVDFDVELTALANAEANTRRAKAIAALQKARRTKNQNLAVWLTLPVIPQGLTEDGTNIIALFLKQGVDLSGVNIMTMDYGQALANGQSMLQGSLSALNETHRQLGILYQQAGINLSSTTLWSKMGATPMIGQNDIEKEVFTTSDASNLNGFAVSKGIGRMSMWSANRDIACGSNYVNTKVVSNSCSGVDQAAGDFANMLGENFNGSIKLSAGVVTVSDSNTNTSEIKDDPANSPYQIWSQTSAYLQGTKVVWHRNVYQAKWWTQGDVPDNPVLQTWQTPWELVGPVLKGEKPVQQPTLPAGTYPEWDGKKVYNTADRILFGGVPYQAKWWNQGQSPAAYSSSPATSAWSPLTQAQINDILAGKGK